MRNFRAYNRGMTEDEVAIAAISASGVFVHAGSKEAYEAFRDGRPIFDITPDARLLRKFQADNKSEFGKDIHTNSDGTFRFYNHPGIGKRVYFTYHWDLHHKYQFLPVINEAELDGEYSE
jgi:hypothetical protein